MRRERREGETAPMTLGQALAAKVRVIVWCNACGHQAEPDVADGTNPKRIRGGLGDREVGPASPARGGRCRSNG
jgi:hypothetical protein